MKSPIMTAQNVKPQPSKNEQSRRPGRPRGARADGRTALLDAALHLFARQGVAKTSLNAIAREAGVTSAMLHYYFNSREQLLDVMIEERFLPLRAEILRSFNQYPESPALALQKTLERLAELADTHRWFAPLWLQETLGQTNHLRNQMHARDANPQRNSATAIIVRWQQENLINPQLEPTLIFTTLLSLILVPFCMLRQQTTEEERLPIDKAAIVNHAVTLLQSGVNASAHT